MKVAWLSKGDIAFMAFFVVALGALSYVLFANNESSVLLGDITSGPTISRNETLSIVYAESLTTYEPTAVDVVLRQYLSNCYEGLVRFDRDFNLEPALALSWGMLDDTTWQFKLRPNVVFHDGSAFDADDVLASFERAQSHPDSKLTTLLSGMESVKKIDPLTVSITTADPDPLLVSELTMLFMVPSELPDEVEKPIGTGPYVFVEPAGPNNWSFDRFADYWGEAPTFSSLLLSYIPDKFERYNVFSGNEVDVLAETPPVFVDALLQTGYPVASLSALEVDMLGFGMKGDNAPFQSQNLRKAVVSALSPEELLTFTSGYALSPTQFVSRGVLGYNPDVEMTSYDIKAAQALVGQSVTPIPVKLDLPEGMSALGTYIQTQLDSIGFQVTVTYWSADDYAAHIAKGESDLYFFGWKSELGDATDFFTHLVHSQTADGRYGAMNYGGYSDPGINTLIERLEKDLLESRRQQEMAELMKLLVEKEVFAVPLFEPKTLVVSQKDVLYEPRLDNLLLASDFH